MKKTLVLTATVAALVLSGCSKKNPEVDLSKGGESLIELANRIQVQAQNVYFDFDRYNIKPEMQAVVNNNAELFNQAGAEALKIKVEGNCDEWGTDEYNYALGLKRATVVKDALVAKGVDADRISVVSYGESNPICTDRSEACDAQNRRDEFKIFVK